VNVKKGSPNPYTAYKPKGNMSFTSESHILPNFSQSLKKLYTLGANQAMKIGGELVTKFPNQLLSENNDSYVDENLDTQVMNIEADFEQLDIGEEPIFERNSIKKTSTNKFKDKMSHL